MPRALFGGRISGHHVRNGSQVRGLSCNFIVQPVLAYCRRTDKIGWHEIALMLLRGIAYSSGRGANWHRRGHSYRWSHRQKPQLGGTILLLESFVPSTDWFLWGSQVCFP